jgi:RecQ family ATP-dependent DNA helicase
MATGGGKSLCYQLPAVVFGGTCIVISPLIALMIDQVQALVAKGVKAALISSSNTEKENMHVLERLAGHRLTQTKKQDQGRLEPLTLLYVTPEQVQTSRFRDILKNVHAQKRLSLIAIDEAHCISSWGHDFRAAYRKLGWLTENFPDVPTMALTATATPKVLKDIQTTLHLTEAPCHVGSFDRSNIFYKGECNSIFQVHALQPRSNYAFASSRVQGQSQSVAFRWRHQTSGPVYQKSTF